ncbi:methylated-DNA--[protein]-cysteine S-methyltransferase [Mucilaginibacter koreensis]
METACMATPLGVAIITENEGYITSVKVTDEPAEVLTSTENAVLNMAISQLNEYFEGRRRAFDLPLKQAGTPFQQSVWQHLMETGFGDTCSYTQLSAQMKNPLAIRAIASANGKNNLWIIVPCHRIIGANGSLTGYAGGLWRKQWLLNHEATVCGKGQMQLSL